MSTRFPPVPLSHRPDCRLAPAHAVPMKRGAALDRWIGLRAHTCVLMGPDTQPLLIETVTYPEHEYEGTMLWPAGAARSLCKTCHGDHLADDNRHVREGSWAPKAGENAEYPEYPR